MNNNSSALAAPEVGYGGANPNGSIRTGLPPWMVAEKISLFERIELWSYKLITYLPVAVTFGVFSFLFIFFSHVSSFQSTS